MSTNISSAIGVDVGKERLYIAVHGQKKTIEIANKPTAIQAWLKTLPEDTTIAMEATSTYHKALLHRAHKRGFAVFVVDGYRLKHYRQGTGWRAKTDHLDAAHLLARYLVHEHSEMHAWLPLKRVMNHLSH